MKKTTFNVEVPEGTLVIAEAYAQIHSISVLAAIEELLTSVAAAHTFHGNLRFLGKSWQQAVVALQKQAQAPKVALSARQLALLERSATLESGYAGVYRNGRTGWRARVMREGKSGWLSTRSEPELAAWDYHIAKQGADIVTGTATIGFEATLRFLRDQYPDREEASLREQAAEIEALRRPPG